MRRQYHSLAHVMEAGRWAWASSAGDETPDFYFDGTAFWFSPPGKGHSTAHGDALPREGWWHAPDCVCKLCRPAGRS